MSEGDLRRRLLEAEAILRRLADPADFATLTMARDAKTYFAKWPDAPAPEPETPRNSRMK